MNAHPNRRRFAFSLMELLAVVTILGVIAAIIIPRVISSSDEAKVSACLYNCRQIHSAVELYRQETGSWPSANLAEIDNVTYFPSGLPNCPVSGDPYTLDIVGDVYRVNGHTNGNHTP